MSSRRVAAVDTARCRLILVPDTKFHPHMSAIPSCAGIRFSLTSTCFMLCCKAAYQSFSTTHHNCFTKKCMARDIGCNSS